VAFNINKKTVQRRIIKYLERLERSILDIAIKKNKVVSCFLSKLSRINEHLKKPSETREFQRALSLLMLG
jgi:hypothetical protein